MFFRLSKVAQQRSDAIQCLEACNDLLSKGSDSSLDLSSVQRCLAKELLEAGDLHRALLLLQGVNQVGLSFPNPNPLLFVGSTASVWMVGIVLTLTLTLTH
jgi:hypothetical protein